MRAGEAWVIKNEGETDGGGSGISNVVRVLQMQGVWRSDGASVKLS